MEHQANEIWRQVHERLRGFIAKRVGDMAEADDILQEVFIRVHRHIEQLREPDRLVSWVFQITRHVLIDYYRTPGRRRELPGGLAEDLEAMYSGTLGEPEAAAGVELSGCLRPLIERLPAEYQQAITLVELEGLTQKQAADRLGLSVPGMKSRVQRGRKQLRMLLEECCVIELDNRKGVVDFEHRRPGSPFC